MSAAELRAENAASCAGLEAARYDGAGALVEPPPEAEKPPRAPSTAAKPRKKAKRQPREAAAEVGARKAR